MIVTEVGYLQVYTYFRIDAEFFRPEFVETEERLKKINSTKLEEVVKLSKLRKDPTREPDKEFRYIEIDNIDLITGSILTQNIIGHEAPSRARKLVQTNDIIISTVRPNRNAIAIIPEELNNCVCSTGFCIIKAEGINPYFLFIFLKTKYAINQLVRKTMASMYPAISENDIREIIVSLPSKPFQEHIEKLVKEAHEKEKIAEKKYNEAKQLLLKELRIEKLELRQDKTFETKFSEVEKSMRFDSGYYHPRYKQVIKLLGNSDLEIKKLKDVAKISTKKIDPAKDPKKFKYIELANVNPVTGEITDYEELVGYNAPSRARMLVKKRDVLVPSLSGSLDNVALVPEELDNSIASTGFFVINSDNFYNECLFLLFKTDLVKKQLEQKTAGAIMAAVPKTTFGHLLVPLIPKPKQENISNLVKESFSLRKEAKNLLEKAKTDVEKMIESEADNREKN